MLGVMVAIHVQGALHLILRLHLDAVDSLDRNEQRTKSLGERVIRRLCYHLYFGLSVCNVSSSHCNSHPGLDVSNCRGLPQAFYEGAAGMGWSDTKKRRQLIAPEARLLIVTGSVLAPPPSRPCPLGPLHHIAAEHFLRVVQFV